MKWFSNINLSKKLPAVIVLVGLIMAIGVGVGGYLVSSNSVAEMNRERLEIVAEGRRIQLHQFVSSIETDLLEVADNPYTHDALSAFSAAWAEIGADQSKLLQRLYIGDNPYPLGEKHKLDAATQGPQAYNTAHGEFHPWFRGHLEKFGYYDIFLFDLKGNLVYSVFKEDDYATNFSNNEGGRWKATDLGAAFRSAVKMPAGSVSFFDFKGYGPSHDAPASFVSVAVADDSGQVNGVLAFQLPSEKFAAITDQVDGLGQTGETFLVGPDHLLRSNASRTEEDDILSVRFENDAVVQALSGQVAASDGVSRNGNAARIAATPLRVFDQVWAVAVAQDSSELNLTTKNLRNAMVSIAIAALALTSLLGVFVARSISKPISRLSATMSDIAGGNLTGQIFDTERGDEIGTMARTVETFRESGLQVQTMNEEKEEREEQSRTERSKMMQYLQESFGSVVEAAISGDFSHRISADFSDSEINDLATSVNDLVSTVERGLSETGLVLAALANADLTQRVTGDFDGAFASLKNNTNGVGERLNAIVGELRDTSGNLKTATGEILAGANDLSQRTGRQAATIEEISAMMTQLAETVLVNATRADKARSNAMEARGTAETGVDVMENATEAMNRIQQSASKISDIIGLIDDIAFQTNLLALNASVEAARAGEAGKGFAVVAIEVRRLAQSAAEASSEVKSLIDQSGSEVESGSKLVVEAADNLGTIVKAVRGMADLMNEIADESKTQAGSIDQLAEAVRDMDEMTQHNAALVEETNAAIEQTESQANELDRIVEIFEVGDDGGNASGVHDLQNRVAASF